MLGVATVVECRGIKGTPGGEAPAEAAGFEAILTGARARLADDDAFLAEVGSILDSLYAHCNKETP